MYLLGRLFVLCVCDCQVEDNGELFYSLDDGHTRSLTATTRGVLPAEQRRSALQAQTSLCPHHPLNHSLCLGQDTVSLSTPDEH